MSYSIKTGTGSGTGLETSSRFWKNHLSAGLSSSKLDDSGIPLDVKDGKVAFSGPEAHCMVCGVSGRGKTRRELYPTVIMSARAGRSLVIADMKGEIYRNTASEVRRCGHDIKVINLRKPSVSDRFSPLALVQRYWKDGYINRAILLLKDVCTLITAKIHSDRDRFWEFAAQDAIMGFALLLLERKYPLTFDNIHGLLNQYYQNKASRADIIRALDIESESYRRLSTIISLDSDTTLSCIVSEVNSALTCYVDQEDVRNLLSDSDIELTDIGRKPTAVYLICPDESTALYGIASLFVEQCYSELVNFADNSRENRLPVKVDFLLDEFGSFVGSDWPSKLTAARSRGIRFIIAIQSLSQLSSRYGDNGARTIMANCRTLVYMGGRDIRLMNEISALSGFREDERTGLEKPALSITDLSRLRTGEIVVLDDSGLPFIGHLPDWEAWGITDRIPYTRSFHIPKPVRYVSLRDVLGITDSTELDQDTSESISEDRAVPKDGDLFEDEVKNTLTIEALICKLNSDPELNERLRECLDRNHKTSERTVNNNDDDDELPF